MGKEVSIKNLKPILNGKNTGKKIVLLGGCFDVLHKGHIEFLRRAKELGEILVVLLESDKKITIVKGNSRPVNNQDKRSRMLSAIEGVDYVVKLPFFKSNDEYEKLVIQLEPDIIAVTRGTHIFDWEKEHMKRTGGKIIEVMEKRKDYSTTKIIRNL